MRGERRVEKREKWGGAEGARGRKEREDGLNWRGETVHEG